jgi:hypothetical protein
MLCRSDPVITSDSKVKLRFLTIAAGVAAYPTIGPQSISEATSRFQILSSRSAGL